MEILTTPKNYKYAKEGMTEKSGGVGWGGWGSKDYSMTAPLRAACKKYTLT